MKKLVYLSPLLSSIVWALPVLGVSLAAIAEAPPSDAFLYYRRTHQGAWPPPGIDPSDHSGETTNTVPAPHPAPLVGPPGPLLDNGIDPSNLGKGDWIWQMPMTQTHLGVTNVQGVIDYEVSMGMEWITVKCGDGGSVWSQFNADLVIRAHAAGLKIFGWAYAYGNNVSGEINVALSALGLGADGFIVDAEAEYEVLANNATAATNYCQGIRAVYPNRFLAHAPFPYLDVHPGFPYATFGYYCDAVMPQVYWGAIGTTPENVVVQMNTRWRTWQATHSASVKPLVPLGQSYAPVTGAEINRFLNALVTNTPMATAGGYQGVSFWDAQERTADMDAAILGNGAPFFSVQPLSRVVDAGGLASFVATAWARAPLKYQWLFNNEKIPDATNATYTVAGAQMTNAGNYTAIATNISGSATSRVATLTVYPIQTIVFSDSFDSNTGTNWIVNKSSSDIAVDFNFDYSALGIPSAPRSTGGTTRGVQMKANLTLGAVAAVSLSPTNQIFSGDYRLRFDGWINVNGPFPAGGPGSTEFLTSGIGTAGNRTEWTGAGSTADGFYFSADGEGGVSPTSTTSGDYCAFIGTALQSTASGIYAAGTGTTARDNADAYYEAAIPGGLSAPTLQQSGFAQQNGSLNTGTFGFAWHEVIVSRRGSTVDWAVDGVRLATLSNATFTASNVFVGFWDPFASLSSNNVINFGLVDNVSVEVPAKAPTISLQPMDLSVKLTSNALFTVAATGLPPPSFQWLFNGTNIPGAAASSYALTQVQVKDRGNYSVIVSNVAGSILSSNAALALIPPRPAQFQSVTLQPDLSLRIAFNGDPEWSYTLEASTNLIDWSAVTNLSSASGVFDFIGDSTTNGTQRFYRARSGP